MKAIINSICIIQSGLVSCKIKQMDKNNNLQIMIINLNLFCTVRCIVGE